MKRSIVSTEQLIKAAGKQRFEAGQLSFESSPVKEFQANEKQAAGKIDGFETSIHYRGEGVEGACTCEESDGFDFCRHCVHLTLHANKIAQQLISLSKGPDKSKILAYLINLDKQVLAKQFLELIEEDTELFQRYLLRASLDNKELDYNALKSRITEVTRLTEKLFSQRQVKHFFARIEHLLDELLLIPYKSQADKLLKLVVYAVQRINKLLDKLDDRANQRQFIVEKLNALYQQLFSEIPGRPETKAKHYFKLWLDDRHQLIADSLSLLQSAPEQLKLFNELVQERWSDDTLDTTQKAKLSRYLLDKAIAENDLVQEQLYRVVLATSAEDWLTIAQRWQDVGEEDKAISILEEQFQTREEKTPFLAKLIALFKDRRDSLASLQKLFCQFPLECADALMEKAEKEGVLPQVREEAIKVLHARKRTEENNLLLRLMIDQGLYTEAYLLVQTIDAEVQLIVSLAKHLSKTKQSDSLALYQRALKILLEKQLSKADIQAAELLQEVDHYFGKYEQTHDTINALRPLLNKRPRVLQLFQEHTS